MSARQSQMANEEGKACKDLQMNAEKKSGNLYGSFAAVRPALQSRPVSSGPCMPGCDVHDGAAQR